MARPVGGVRHRRVDPLDQRRVPQTFRIVVQITGHHGEHFEPLTELEAQRRMERLQSGADAALRSATLLFLGLRAGLRALRDEKRHEGLVLESLGAVERGPAVDVGGVDVDAELHRELHGLQD